MKGFWKILKIMRTIIIKAFAERIKNVMFLQYLFICSSFFLSLLRSPLWHVQQYENNYTKYRNGDTIVY